MGNEGSQYFLSNIYQQESGFMLTKTEYDNIFKYFDKNCDDEVSF